MVMVVHTLDRGLAYSVCDHALDCPDISQRYRKMDKLNIANEMRCFDRKDREFYDSPTDEERKKFYNYLMIRWGSSVEGGRDLQEFYVIATNERLNKNFFAINRHPKLQWLTATTVSPGMGSHRHTWIPVKKKESSNRAGKKMLSEIIPAAKNDDIDAMLAINDEDTVTRFYRDHGQG